MSLVHWYIQGIASLFERLFFVFLLSDGDPELPRRLYSAAAVTCLGSERHERRTLTAYSLAAATLAAYIRYTAQSDFEGGTTPPGEVEGTTSDGRKVYSASFYTELTATAVD